MASSRWLPLFAAVAILIAGEARAAKDTRPPTIEHAPVTGAVAGELLTITAKITDESEIFEPTLYYRSASSKKYLTASMLKASGAYTAQIPGAATRGDVEYFIEAYDALGNGPARFASDKKPQRVKVGPPPAKVEAAPQETPAQPKDEGEAIAIATVEASSGDSDPQREPPAADPAPEADAPPTAADLDLRDEPRTGTSPLKIAGFSAAGAGVVALGVGAYFGIASRSLNEEARTEPSALTAQQKLDDARSNATRANVALIAGGVLAVGGAVLALLPDSPAADEAPATVLLGPGGAGVSVRF